MDDEGWVRALLGHLGGMDVESVERRFAGIRIRARAIGQGAACPKCGVVAQHVHGRYERRMLDTPTGNQTVELRVTVRRFRCRESACVGATFVEQVEDVTTRHGRRSLGLQALLQVVALWLAGRAGARVAEALRAPTSRSSLLRILARMPAETVPTPRVLGVDDFALRKGHIYGTILVDVETHRPIDLLPSRETDALVAWLREHPGVEIICRDRASAYAEAARIGAPDAVNIADRWHIYHNLCEAVERIVARHCAQLRPPLEPTPAPPAPLIIADQATASPAVERDTPPRLAARLRERHAEVHALLERGRSQRQIAADLHLARNTVRRYARATSAQELMTGQWQHERASILDPHHDYLVQRINQGQDNAARLHEEITQLGYRGSLTRLRTYLQPLRTGHTKQARDLGPSVREATRWITTHPDKLIEPEKDQLKAILERCPDLDATASHVRSFATMMRDRAGKKLNAWMRSAAETGLPELRSFVSGIEQDHAAVLNALTYPYSSGVVEGNVNRIKMLKLQTYGKAGFSLLRTRVLHTR